MKAVDDDLTLIGLLYTGEGSARWCWYIGRDWSAPHKSREKAKAALFRALEVRGLRDYAYGNDRPLAAYLTETGRIDQYPTPPSKTDRRRKGSK